MHPQKINQKEKPGIHRVIKQQTAPANECLPSVDGWEALPYSAGSNLFGSLQLLFGSSSENETNSAQTSVR